LAIDSLAMTKRANLNPSSSRAYSSNSNVVNPLSCTMYSNNDSLRPDYSGNRNRVSFPTYEGSTGSPIVSYLRTRVSVYRGLRTILFRCFGISISVSVSNNVSYA
jgi:hypothetical protein